VKTSLVSLGTAPRRRIRGVEVQLHTSLIITLKGCELSASRHDRFTSEVPVPQYSLDRRPYGSQSRFGRYGKDIKSHYCPFREMNPSRTARSLVSILITNNGYSRTIQNICITFGKGSLHCKLSGEFNFASYGPTTITNQHDAQLKFH
jgi:hypothetical protein